MQVYIAQRLPGLRRVAVTLAILVALGAAAHAQTGGQGGGNFNGGGGSCGGAAGASSATGGGGAGGNGNCVNSGGGGGGAGTTGGQGGTSPDGAAGGAGGVSGVAGGAGGAGASPAGGPQGFGQGGGGGGGAHGLVVTTTSTLTTSVTGGDGGAGGVGIGDAGGGGGAGGYGVVVENGVNATVNAAATGGKGGAGETSQNPFGANGGDGGFGLFVSGASTITNNSSIIGGNGGAGGINVGCCPALGGNGGNGAAGISLASGSTLVNSATIIGGNGGAGGNTTDTNNTAAAGSGGNGGVGVTGSNATITNSGTITGGAGGAAGTGITNGLAGTSGAGISGSNLTIINSGSISGASGANAITFTGGSNFLGLQGAWSLTGNIALDGASSLSFTQTTSATLSNVITGTGTVIKTGAGTLTLTAANTYSGGTTVSGGLINFNATSNFGSGNITLNGGGLQWASGNTADISGRLNAIGSGGATFDYNGNGVTLGTQLTGTGGVTIANSGSGGILTLAAAESYTGATTINAGATLALSGSGDISSSSVVTVNGTFDISAQALLFGAITTLAGNGSVALGTKVLVITGGSTEFSGAINGGGGLEFAGGIQTLSGVNGYAGVTQIDGGATLALKGSGSIANSLYLGFASGLLPATLDISQTNGGASVTGLYDPTGRGAISLGSKTLTITAHVGPFNGTIQDGGIGGGTGGNVTIANGAVATFGGVNTFTGLTTINSGGELFLTGAGSIASSKAVINNGYFDIAGRAGDASIASLSGTSAGVVNLGAHTLTFTNANGTFAGIIQDGGAGGSVAITGGKEILTGVNTYTGSTTVNGGTLEVDGSIASSSKVTVNSGGTLSGTGVVGAATVTVGNVTVGGTLTVSDSNPRVITVTGGTDLVNNLVASSSAPLSGGVDPAATAIMSGGTLAPGGAANPTGTLTVNGNLAFQSGAIYLVQVTPTLAASTNVSGTATLGGAAVNAVFANGSYISKQYTILSAGSVSGTFGSLANSNLPANFSDTLSYDATHAYLNLTLNFVAPSAPNYGGGLSMNQQNVANTLVNFFNTTGGIPTVFGTLAPAGLTQASGELATGSQQTTFDAMNLFMGLLTDPFMNRTGGLGSMPSATGYADEGDTSAYAATRKADAFAMFTKAPSAPFVQRWNVWAAGFGGSQSTSGNAVVGSNNTTSSVYGTAVGADYLFSPNTVAGFAIAGGGTNFSVANSGGGRSDLFQAGVYVRHTEGPAYISAALAYGWQDITTNRTVTAGGIDQLRAEFDANAYSGRIEGGYRFVAPWVGGVGITPYAAGQFTTFDLPAYAERVISGLPSFALGYAGKSVTDTRSELGFRTDKSFPVQDGVLTLRTRFGWAHDYDPNRAIAATFQALPGASFVVNGAAQASDSALTTASVEMKWRNGWSAAATFEGEFSDVTSSYAGKGVVRYQW
ncbi:autotransporter domain-containing protein [Bradyrhizobium septentrionale]|uniref:autotransporter domain-containing protein n=1 Tax=Bradyrhizobium septentrionale TaxID=1404411 RepID=UPI0015970302|nr:autotransporter domain-containing protein [Bradyrhizobium septentrionale]